MLIEYMIKTLRKTQPIYLVIDLWCMLTSFWVPYIIRFSNFSKGFTDIRTPNFTEYSFVFLLQVTLMIIAFKQKKLYATDRGRSIPREFLNVITRIFYVSIIVGSMIFFAHYLFFSRFVFVMNFVLLVLLLGGWRIIKRLILRKLIREGFRNINILIVGAGRISELLVEEIKQRAYLGFRIVGFLDNSRDGFVENIPILGKLSDFAAVVKKYFVDEVIIGMSPENKAVAELIKQTIKMRLGVRMVSEYFEEPLHILDVSYMGIIPMLTYKIKKPHPSEAISKKTFDLVASLLLIILLSPAFLIIAVLIKLGSSGPVFFVSKRIGVKGLSFNFYKFRSMSENADELKDKLLEQNEMQDKVMFKIKKDPRVTRIGRFLRMYSLDELPQLFNVLKGDMSLVGPRPPLPDEVEKYSHNHIDRLSIKPGVTGLSQIRGRSDLSFSRWVRWDLWYVNNWSFWLDMKILLWTIPTVLKGKGAY